MIAQRCFSALKMISLPALVNFPINAAPLIIHQTANEAIKLLLKILVPISITRAKEEAADLIAGCKVRKTPHLLLSYCV